jgi:hypothetical protein
MREYNDVAKGKNRIKRAAGSLRGHVSILSPETGFGGHNNNDSGYLPGKSSAFPQAILGAEQLTNWLFTNAISSVQEYGIIQGHAHLKVLQERQESCSVQSGG